MVGRVKNGEGGGGGGGSEIVSMVINWDGGVGRGRGKVKHAEHTDGRCATTSEGCSEMEDLTLWLSNAVRGGGGRHRWKTAAAAWQAGGKGDTQVEDL